jgi:hypothetical protein
LISKFSFFGKIKGIVYLTKEELKYGEYHESYANFKIPILFNTLVGAPIG